MSDGTGTRLLRRLARAGRALGLLAAAIAAPVVADTTLPRSVRLALNTASIPEASYAAVVMTLDGQVMLSRNAEVAMNPASVMKLVTTFAAFETLGPAYTWRTEVHTTGPVLAGRLQGNLVIRGGGDPRLSLEDFWMLLRDARARGVRDIDGDVILDRSWFAEPDIDPGAFDGRPTRPYNAGPDALLLNFRSVRLTFAPDPEGRAVRVLMEPPLPGINVISRLTLENNLPCDGWPEDPAVDLPNRTLTFEGRYPLACGEQAKSFVLLPPAEYAAALFDHLWRNLGGTLRGSVKTGTLDPAAKLLTGLDSAPLAEIVRDINKNSNNVMTRHLFLTLGRSGGAATLDGARTAVTQSLKRAGIDAPELVLENGAGLSRIERVSAGTLARLLATAAVLPTGPEFIASMPIAAVDGTARRWFRNTPVAGRAHLKTGYLENVRAVAGYVHGTDGRTLVVVSIVNHPGARNAVGVQEALVQWAFENTASARCCHGMQRANRKGQSSGSAIRP